jgi:membrane protease YdiL (CAAX protease family)
MSPLAAALWAVALWVTVMFAVSVTESIRPGARTDIINLAACQVLATSLVVFAMLRWHAPELPMRQLVGMRPIAPLHVIFSVAAGAGLFPLLSTLDDIILRRWPIQEADAADSIHRLLTSSSRTSLVLAAFVAVPIAQELFFRGILYGGVRATVNVRAAIVATSVFYACSYLEPQQMPRALLLGLALAWLRERTGTVVAPVLAQLAYGAVVGIPILRGQDPEADVTFPVKWIAGGAVIAALALAAVAVRRRPA